MYSNWYVRWNFTVHVLRENVKTFMNINGDIKLDCTVVKTDKQR